MSWEISRLVWLLLALLAPLLVVGGAVDVDCLKEFKESVEDPNEYLAGWNFTSPSSSATVNLCSFVGVTCLSISDNTVYILKLSNFGLEGSFPAGLSKCATLTQLDLSGNNFSGPISPTLCKDVPYLVAVYLDRNELSGPIPANLGNCSFLNDLYLQNNQLTGEIPSSLGNLARLVAFNVSSNNLTGDIPYALGQKFNASSFENNPCLRGAPLDRPSECSAP